MSGKTQWMTENSRWLIYLFIVISFSAGCSNAPAEKNNESIGREVIGLLVNEGLEDMYHQYFSDELKKSLPLATLKQTWEKQIDVSGDYVDTSSFQSVKRGEKYYVVEAELEYTQIIFPVRMIFNEENKLISFFIENGVVNSVIPDSLTEEDIVIGEGTDYKLGGTLTLPNQEEGPLPAVVLVQGSGPSDRDSTAYAYKPFRDIAWGLAQYGMAVLRYDKRTYTYRDKAGKEDMREVTVHEETVEDAILAASLLKKDPRIDSNRVYLLGHSLGGMLAPRIDHVGGDFAGLIIMAGSPRPLWEIIYDQNIALLTSESIEESKRQELKRLIEEEYEKAKRLSTEDIENGTIFSLPAHYLKDMERNSAKELLLELEKPVLILQGEDDFQVYFKKDFMMYQDILKDHKNVTFISYPRLNHFFIEYEGEDEGTIAEYEYPRKVHEQVIRDIATWLLSSVTKSES